MKGLRKNFMFTALCLAVGLVVFGVSYTLMGQRPGDDETGPVGNVNDPPGTPAPNPTPGGPGIDEGEPGPVGQVNELFDVLVGGDVPALEQILEDGVDPNAFNDDGISALQWTILGSGKVETVYGQVKALLAAGANPNLANNSGWTPLHYASRFGGTDAVVSKLIDSGGDPNITNSQGATPLHLALLTGNRGAVSALQKATSIRPQDYEKLEEMGNISKRLKSAETQKEKKAIFMKDIDRLVKQGWISEAEKEAVLNAIENKAGCTTCD